MKQALPTLPLFFVAAAAFASGSRKANPPESQAVQGSTPAPISAPTTASAPAAASSPNLQEVSPRMGSSKDAPRFKTGELLVSFRTEAAAAGRAELFQKYGVVEKEKVGSTDLYLVTFPKTVDVSELQKKISAEPGVKYAEPNLIMRAFKN